MTTHKKTAFSGVFPTVAGLNARGANTIVHDPMFTDDELRVLGFQPYHLGEPADAVIVQADHPEYARMGPADFPGVQVLIDGRRITLPEVWKSVKRLVIGDGQE